MAGFGGAGSANPGGWSFGNIGTNFGNMMGGGGGGDGGQVGFGGVPIRPFVSPDQWNSQNPPNVTPQWSTPQTPGVLSNPWG